MQLRKKYTATRGEILTKTASRAQIGIWGFPRHRNSEKTKNVELRRGISVSWVNNKCPVAPTSSCAGEMKALFYGFNMATMLKGPLSELTFGNMGVEIRTYARGDKPDVTYQVDSVNTATNGERLNGSLESNLAELGENNCLIVGYIHGDINTSDGLTKSLSISNLRSLLSGTHFPISYGRKENGIRRKTPSAKRYIVYHETSHGRKDLDTDVRRKTRAGRCRQMVLGWKSSLNSFLCV